MSNHTTAAPVADRPCGGRTSTPKLRREDTPSEASFKSFLADPRLTPFDKVLLTVLASYCLAAGNAFAFPGTAELARRAGVDGVEDGGKARVNRSLARMERMGLLDRIAWYEIDEFMAAVGRPKMGLADPREKADNPRRYLLLWWKVPGLSDGFSVALRRPPLGGARDRLDGRVGGAVDTHRVRPAPPRKESTAPPLQNCSNSELLNSNEDVNVDAALAPENRETPEAGPIAVAGPLAPRPPFVAAPPPTEDQVAAWIRQARSSPRAFERTIAVAELVGCGRCPEDLAPAGRWSAVGTTPEVPMPRPATPAAPAAPSPTTTVDLLRRLATPCGPEAVESAARKLASDLDDMASINFHRKRLAEVRTGRLPLKVVLAALKSSQGSGVADRRKVYVNFIEAGRERL